MQALPRPRTPVSPTPGTGPQLQWHLRHARPPRLVFTGEIDLGTADEFDRALAQAAAHHSRLIIDLTAVTFLGSTAIHTLYAHLGSLVAVLVTPDNTAARSLSIVTFPCLVVVPTDQPRPASAATAHPLPS